MPQDSHAYILKDEIIVLKNKASQEKYPKRLRPMAVWDDANRQTITNQLSWTVNTISELYKSRWQIEIFFREIKQLLHIKTFTGTTENAVMVQIWTALITILILKALKAMAKFNWHLSNLVAFIRLNIFVKITLQDWLDKPLEEPPSTPPPISTQGALF